MSRAWRSVVSAGGGRRIVALAGEVNSYMEWWKVEHTAERVKGRQRCCRRPDRATSADWTDTDIVEAVLDALCWNMMVPSDAIN